MKSSNIITKNNKRFRIVEEVDGMFFIFDEDKKLYPSIYASEITFDEEKQVFLMRDVINLGEGVSVNLYFYLDLEFKPTGLAFNDLTFGYEMIPYDEEVSFEVIYEKYKEELKLRLSKQLIKQKEEFIDVNKKMIVTKE